MKKSSLPISPILPPVGVVEITSVSPSGEMLALFAQGERGGAAQRSAQILLELRATDPALAPGDRALCHLDAAPADAAPVTHLARLIRALPVAKAREIIGVFEVSAEGGRIVSVSKKDRTEWLVRESDRGLAAPGDLVCARQTSPKGRMGLPLARVLRVIGASGAAQTLSHLAMAEQEIEAAFSQDVLAELEALPQLGAADLAARRDLRDLPLVTIDPADARDHDDAIYAEPDDDPRNPGGHRLWIAIADVAFYVRPGTALDRAARQRGNSTYFPDQVVPMLPERLSGDLCSLHAGVDRPALVLEVQISAAGATLSHAFHRALIRIHHALSYPEAEAFHEAQAPSHPAQPVLAALYAAHGALMVARAARAPLNLDLPERKITLNDAREVVDISFPPRLQAHQLVEDFMVLANVCAAKSLEAARVPLLYRAHEEPARDRRETLSRLAKDAGFAFAKGQPLSTRLLNRLLDQASGTVHQPLINLAVLRSMAQAFYTEEPVGHFGLNLKAYAHFTSPIRRYADLVIHRALMRAHGWEPQVSRAEQAEERAELAQIAAHISQTERRSMRAERDTNDRYLAAYMAQKIGAEFTGHVSGLAKFGVFIRLDETGADGFVPMSHLGDEFWRHDDAGAKLVGLRSKREIALGMAVTVRLAEAAPLSGGLRFELLTLEGRAFHKGRARRSSLKAEKRAQKTAKPGRSRAKGNGKGKSRKIPPRKA